MFKNLINNPTKATDFEINALDQRRKLEKQLILDLDIEASQEEERVESDDSYEDLGDDIDEKNPN